MMAVVAVAADCQRQVTPDVTVGRTIRVGGMDTRGLYGARARLRAERSSRGDAGSVECAQRHVRALLLGSYSSCWRGDVGCGALFAGWLWGQGACGFVAWTRVAVSRGLLRARWHVLDPTPLHMYTQLWRRSEECALSAACCGSGGVRARLASVRDESPVAHTVGEDLARRTQPQPASSARSSVRAATRTQGDGASGASARGPGGAPERLPGGL